MALLGQGNTTAHTLITLLNLNDYDRNTAHTITRKSISRREIASRREIGADAAAYARLKRRFKSQMLRWEERGLDNVNSAHDCVSGHTRTRSKIMACCAARLPNGHQPIDDYVYNIGFGTAFPSIMPFANRSRVSFGSSLDFLLNIL